MITVWNKHKGHPQPDRDTMVVEYVGRPSPLGNIFPVSPSRSRDVAIQQYDAWLTTRLLDPESVQSAVIRQLTRLARKEDVALVCWCAPRPCHADVIKRIIEERLAQEDQ